MVRRPPRSTRTDTLFPYTTLFRSWQQVAEARRLSRPGAVAQDRGLPAQRRLGSPVRIRRPGGAGEHAVALLLHPARRSRHRDLDAVDAVAEVAVLPIKSEEHTSELQSLMRIPYPVPYLKKQQQTQLSKSQHITT